MNIKQHISFFLTLQYCIGFAIYQHESDTGIHMFPILNPPPSPYHPSGSSQHTSPKHPVSCIEPGLAIHFIYDIIPVSMPFSQIIPPSPTPTESKDCSIHLCLFCSLAYRVIGEGNGNPLQYSCLENPMDGETW